MNVDSDLEVVAWRERQLEAVGFEGAAALELASNRRIDLHALLTLLERGCPPHLAVRILAPIGELAGP
jgi:hypothetical protein